MRAYKTALKTGALLTGFAALLHIGIIFGGADWYRFFGAGEEMAQMDASGSYIPALSCAFIASVLTIWALYALSGAGVIRRLPFLRTVLALTASVFLIRGIAGVPMVLLENDPHMNELKARMIFIVLTSAFCLILGICYLIGTAAVWKKAPERYS